jgi:EmrB/QacA subfamily drug resistance transporter
MNRKQIFILAATIVASGTSFLMSSVLSIAAPSIQSYFEVDFSKIQWIVNAYTLTLSVLILASGSIADKVGRKKVFTSGITLFTFSALLSALAPTVNTLIFFQFLQGIGAALMIPGSLAIINTNFPKEKRAQAIGLWAGLSGALSSIGPLLGGTLIGLFFWRAIFLIIVPLGLLALFISIKYIDESKSPDTRRIDWIGISFITLFFTSLAYSLIQGPKIGFSATQILISVGISIFSLLVIIVNEVYNQKPIIPKRFFKNNSLIGANILTLIEYFILSGVIFYTSTLLQQAKGYSPATAGIALIPLTITITLLVNYTGKLTNTLRSRDMMIAAAILVSIGLSLFLFLDPNQNIATLEIMNLSINFDINYIPLFFGLLIIGVGFAILIPPLTSSALEVEDKFSGLASGINNSVSRLAGMIAITLIGSIILINFSANLSPSLNKLDIEKDVEERIIEQDDKLLDIDIPDSVGMEKEEDIQDILKDNFVDSFKIIILFCIVISLGSIFSTYYFLSKSQ